jgi:hypothetical protein
MKPLLFLTTRSVLNGIRRALTTPRRLITVLIFCGYYYYFFVRPSLGSRGQIFPKGIELSLPPLDILEAVVFALFSGLSVLLMLTIFSQAGGFKPADVDMLFPTPLPPKLILSFRLARDYIATLLLPVFFGLFAFVPISRAWTEMFRKMPDPEAAGMAIRSIGLAWLLMALVWVSITYAVNLFINRSDLRSDRNKKVLVWATILVVLGVVGYLVLSLSTLTSPEEAVELAHSPLLRSFFFTATLASHMVMSPLTGNWGLGLAGAMAMIAIAVVAVKVAMTQSSWLYDQAAVKGFGGAERRQLQQAGDFYGMVASMAKEGKLKAGRRTWVHRWRLQGPAALFWKDIFLQTRGMKFLMLLLFAIALFMNLMPSLAAGSIRRSPEMAAGVIFLVMQLVTLLMMTLSYAQTGFMELLRRVDTQKPLPFTPATTVFVEVISKSALGTFGSWASAVVLLVAQPLAWPFVVAAMVVAPFASVLISSAALLLTLMFPDIDDPSQRPIRGILMMLAILVFAVPGGTIALGGFALLSALKVSIPMAVLLLAVPVALTNLGVTFLVTTMSGNLYANYNPSE